EREVVGMKWGAVARRRGRNEQRAASKTDRLACFGKRALRVAPRHGTDRDQPRVVRAERGHRAVVRSGAAEEQLLVVSDELRRGEGTEDELLGDAEEVERTAPFPRVEGAERRPPLDVHESPLEIACGRRITPTGGSLTDGPLGECACGAEVEWSNAIANVRI